VTTIPLPRRRFAAGWTARPRRHQKGQLPWGGFGQDLALRRHGPRDERLQLSASTMRV
jgi:hypothetical protein